MVKVICLQKNNFIKQVMIKKISLILIITLLVIFLIGKVYVYNVIKQGDKFYKNENYEKALIEYNKGDVFLLNDEIKNKQILTKKSIMLKNVLEKASQYLKQGNYQKSISFFTMAINVYENNESYFYRGLSYFKLNDFKNSIKNFNKLNYIDKETDTIVLFGASDLILKDLIYRALAKYNLEDYRGAISDLTKVIKISETESPLNYEDNDNNSNKKNPLIIKAYLELGNSYLKLSKIDEACLSWSKAGELGDYKSYELIKKYCNIDKQ